MGDKENINQDHTRMQPEKKDQQKVDQEIRKGAGSADEENTSNSLNKEDVPDSTNQSSGNTGSGQRQDSN